MAAALDRAITWLLLRMKSVFFLVTRQPSVAARALEQWPMETPPGAGRPAWEHLSVHFADLLDIGGDAAELGRHLGGGDPPGQQLLLHEDRPLPLSTCAGNC